MSNQSTYQNDNINVTLTREPGCRVKLQIVVSPAATKASYQKAVKSINKEVNVPGFRKGKAPEDMVIKKFRQHIEGEWKETLLNTTFEEAINLTKVYPFNKGSVKSAQVKSISNDEGSTVHIEYESFPDVPEVDPANLKIPKVTRKTITEKDMEKTLHDLRVQRAEWTEITDRPAQEGDYVEIDIDALSDPAHNICTNSLFVVEKDKMGEWMRKLIIGMTPGKTVEGMSEKDHHDDENCDECASGEPHEHKFIPTLCRITLHRIKTPTLPVLDDELAKHFGATSVDTLKERVMQSLNKNADEEFHSTQRSQMEQELISKYPFDIPYSILQAQLKENKKAIIDDLRASGTEESKIQEEAKKIEEQLLHKLNRDFRVYFLTQKIAQDNHVEVTQDEIMMELMRQMWLAQMGQGSFNPNADPKEMQNQLRLQLTMTKALDFLINGKKS